MILFFIKNLSSKSQYMSSNQDANKTLRRIRAENKFIQNYQSTKSKFTIDDCHIVAKGLLLKQLPTQHQNFRRKIKTASNARSKTVSNREVCKTLDHSASHQLYIGNIESLQVLQLNKMSIVSQKSPSWTRKHCKINCLASERKEQEKKIQSKQKNIIKTNNSNNFVFGIKMEAYDQKQLRVGNRKSSDKREVFHNVQKKIKNHKHWSQIKKDLQQLKDNNQSPFPFLFTPDKVAIHHEKIPSKNIEGFHSIKKAKPIIKIQINPQQENNKMKNFRQLIQGSIGTVQFSSKANSPHKISKQVRKYSCNPSVMSYRQKNLQNSKQLLSPTKISAWQAKQFAWMDISQHLIQ